MKQYSETVKDLFSAQLKEWELPGINYSLLAKVMTRELDFGQFRMLVQYNPERMRSSAAKVDPKSIKERPCFLCKKNRPAEQRGISFGDDLTILVNPFPIFKKHLTIPSGTHRDQLISGNFKEMLQLARAIPDYTVFYNGPECGASAPDHFHFQAGNRGFLPVETDFSEGKLAQFYAVKRGVELWHWPDYKRGMITLKGSDPEELNEVFTRIFKLFSALQPEKKEAMLNILTYFIDTEWIIHIIPRKLHRPAQFFKTGSDQILLSPASVDLGGVIIVPREEDFLKISVSDVEDILSQVCYNENEIAGILKGDYDTK